MSRQVWATSAGMAFNEDYIQVKTLRYQILQEINGKKNLQSDWTRIFWSITSEIEFCVIVLADSYSTISVLVLHQFQPNQILQFPKISKSSKKSGSIIHNQFQDRPTFLGPFWPQLGVQ